MRMSSKELPLETLMNDRRMHMVSESAARFGVSAAVIDYKAGSDLAEAGYYIVAGLGHFPDFSTSRLSPKAIERQAARNRNLFYPKVFAEEITAGNIDTAFDDLMLYCQRAEVIDVLYRAHNCEVPDVMCYGEMTNLISFNDSAANQKYDYVLRGEYSRLIDRFFENEARIQKSRRHRELMAYVRSDRYDGPLDKFKRDLAFFRLREKQEIPLHLLHATSAEITMEYINERIFQDMKLTLAYTPYVFYSTGPLEKHDFGRIAGSQDPWKGEERYFELRPVYYKKIDEPEMASAFIRAEFIDTPTRDCIAKGLREESSADGRPVARYVPYRAMDQFIFLAKENKLQFTFDYYGMLLAPMFARIPVITAGKDAKLLDSILSWIDKYTVQEHWLHEHNMPYLIDSKKQEALIRSASEWAAWIPDLADIADGSPIPHEKTASA